MAFVKGNEIPTIDVVLVTITTQGDTPTELALNTASKIALSTQTETEDAVKLIIKGSLKAQKPSTTTITGTTITLTDNVFNPELAKILQGGTITYDAVETTKVTSYSPPVSGSTEKGEVFTLNAYSARYDAAGLIVEYEKISYPNCQGTPFALSSEDGAFRVPEYIINSAPKSTEAPYTIDYVSELPTVA